MIVGWNMSTMFPWAPVVTGASASSILCSIVETPNWWMDGGLFKPCVSVIMSCSETPLETLRAVAHVLSVVADRCQSWCWWRNRVTPWTCCSGHEWGDKQRMDAHERTWTQLDSQPSSTQEHVFTWRVSEAGCWIWSSPTSYGSCCVLRSLCWPSSSCGSCCPRETPSHRADPGWRSGCSSSPES